MLSAMTRTTTGSGRRARRFAVGLVAATAVTGLAGCGGTSGGQDAADAATKNLRDAAVVSVALHLDDPKNSLAGSVSTPEEKRVQEYISESTITMTVDPAGDTAVGATPEAVPTDPVEALKKSGSVEFAFARAGKQVLAVRMINGVLYAKADLAELSTISGEDLDSKLSTGVPPSMSSVTEGLKAGKWLSLDLPAMLAEHPELKSMLSGGGASLSAGTAAELQTKLLAALNDNSTKTVTSNGSETTVTMSVEAKAFLTAALDAFSAAGVAGLDSSLSDAKDEIATLSDGTVDVSVTVKDDHYTKAALDLGSVAKLSDDAEAVKGLDGVVLVADIDDSASPVSAPAEGDTVDLAPLVGTLLNGFGAGMGSLPGQATPTA